MNERCLIPVSNSEEVWNIQETKTFFSVFKPEKNIGLKELKELSEGKALIDLSDGEYIHWIQLSDEAREFLKASLN